MKNNKWVRVMFDYSSSGLWHEDLIMMSPEELPVTVDLSERIKKWVAIYDKHSWEEDVLSQKLNTNKESKSKLAQLQALCIEHFNTGVMLAVEIKKQLPDWTVMVYNDNPDILQLPRDLRLNSEITADFNY